MKRIFFVLCAPLVLSACLNGAGPEVMEEQEAMMEAAMLVTTAQEASAVVTSIMAEQVPGPVGVTLTECLIVNATGAELTILASGPSPQVTLLVSEILQRQSTVDCASVRLST